MHGYPDTSAIQTLKAETPRNRSIASMPTELRLIRAYTSAAATGVLGNSYGRTTATGTGVALLWVRAYYDYGYGRTTTMATGVLRLRLRAYYD